MLEFRYPELKDREWVQPILSSAGGLGSEYAFGTMYVWRGTYHRRICRYKDFLLSAFGEDYRSYEVPEGVGDRREAISVLMEDARERGVPWKAISPAGSITCPSGTMRTIYTARRI